MMNHLDVHDLMISLLKGLLFFLFRFKKTTIIKTLLIIQFIIINILFL